MWVLRIPGLSDLTVGLDCDTTDGLSARRRSEIGVAALEEEEEELLLSFFLDSLCPARETGLARVRRLYSRLRTGVPCRQGRSDLLVAEDETLEVELAGLGGGLFPSLENEVDSSSFLTASFLTFFPVLSRVFRRSGFSAGSSLGFSAAFNFSFRWGVRLRTPEAGLSDLSDSLALLDLGPAVRGDFDCCCSRAASFSLTIFVSAGVLTGRTTTVGWVLGGRIDPALTDVDLVIVGSLEAFFSSFSLEESAAGFCLAGGVEVTPSDRRFRSRWLVRVFPLSGGFSGKYEKNSLG